MESEEISKTAARAEARRRKILENSNNRLGKITGRIHNEGKIVTFDLLIKIIKIVILFFFHLNILRDSTC
jgi:hypothetical protein